MRRPGRRALWSVAAALALGWITFGVPLAQRRAAPVPTAPDELRGAWHVHTTRSDGRGTLPEVVAAARDAGLQFLVVTDHDRIAPAEQGWHDGVLVVEGLEASTALGHVVALGIDRPLDAREAAHPLDAIEARGGEAVIAHPLHPRRPFRGFGGPPRWTGFEIFSNDTAWYQALAERAWGRIARAALELPWDARRAVVDLAAVPEDELARFDAAQADARAAGDRRHARALLCSADAHGFPSYRAGFAVTMHVPVRPTGDGAADARAVAAALLDGSAVCVLEARGAVRRVRFTGGRDAALDVELAQAAPDAHVRAVHEGRQVRDLPIALAAGPNHLPLAAICADACAPGGWRLEVWRGGAPWLFTNGVRIE